MNDKRRAWRWSRLSRGGTASVDMQKHRAGSGWRGWQTERVEHTTGPVSKQNSSCWQGRRTGRWDAALVEMVFGLKRREREGAQDGLQLDRGVWVGRGTATGPRRLTPTEAVGASECEQEADRRLIRWRLPRQKRPDSSRLGEKRKCRRRCVNAHTSGAADSTGQVVTAGWRNEASKQTAGRWTGFAVLCCSAAR